MNSRTENQPLLEERDSLDRAESIEDEPARSLSSEDGTLLRWIKSLGSRKAYIYFLIFGLHVVIQFVFCLSDIPEIALFERVICRQHYGYPESVDESMCRLSEVQDKLAYFRGLKGALDSIPGTVFFVFI